MRHGSTLTLCAVALSVTFAAAMSKGGATAVVFLADFEGDVVQAGPSWAKARSGHEAF